MARLNTVAITGMWLRLCKKWGSTTKITNAYDNSQDRNYYYFTSLPYCHID